MTEVTFLIDEIPVKAIGIEKFSEEDAAYCLEEIRRDEMLPIKHVEVSWTPEGELAVDYDLEQPKFERIRRITGYLVGTMDRWNDAKRQEEHERVKHELCKK